jgi:two-component system response regulator HydG
MPLRSPAKVSDFMARILCVDGENPLGTLQCAVLESAGHVVTAAISVREACVNLQTDSYDVVITDWRFPDGNGRAVIQAARNNSTVRAVLVVAVFLDEAYSAAEPLPDLYLEKPVNPEELIIIVSELLKQQGSSTPQAGTPDSRNDRSAVVPDSSR